MGIVTPWMGQLEIFWSYGSNHGRILVLGEIHSIFSGATLF